MIACDLVDIPLAEADALVAAGARPWVQPHCHACLRAARVWDLPAAWCIQTHLDPPRPCAGCLANQTSGVYAANEALAVELVAVQGRLSATGQHP